MKTKSIKSLKTKKQTKKRLSKKLLSSLLLFVFVKNAISKFNRVLFYFAGVSISFIFITLICAFYFFITTQQEISAVIADDILRPTVGSEKTILIESIYYYFEDYINQLKYSFGKKPDYAIAKIASPSAIVKKIENEEFELDNIAPLASASALPGEGIWEPIKIGSQESNMARTIYRPDPKRPYALATIVKLNMNKLIISSAAGLNEPGGIENPGPGKIPPEIQKSGSLAAAFNGGFKKNDGFYGLIVGKKTYLPLATGAATLILYQDSKPKIIKYTGQKLIGNLLAARQNGPLLIDNSKIATEEKAWDMQTWGLTITNDMYTWRSGIGVTKDGHLIYACGPSLVPYTLAVALKSAGAVNAMQLDINPVWVRFVLFEFLGNEKYQYQPLVADMINGGEQYLNGFQRDFFYVYKK